MSLVVLVVVIVALAVLLRRLGQHRRGRGDGSPSTIAPAQFDQSDRSRSKRLMTLVVGYDDVDVALSDLGDLAAVREAHSVGEYEAAVVRNAKTDPEVVATTVDARRRGTLLGAGLGAVVGAVVSPVLAVAVVGAGFGAIFGIVADQISAFKHADMREVQRLVDDSLASLIIVADEATIREISQAAISRGRRIVMRFTDADVDLLQLELQRGITFGGIGEADVSGSS